MCVCVCVCARARARVCIRTCFHALACPFPSRRNCMMPMIHSANTLYTNSKRLCQRSAAGIGALNGWQPTSRTAGPNSPPPPLRTVICLDMVQVWRKRDSVPQTCMSVLRPCNGRRSHSAATKQYQPPPALQPPPSLSGMLRTVVVAMNSSVHSRYHKNL